MSTLIVAGKGGGGKTTTAFNIAIIARASGLRVGLLDSDPQRSLSDMRVARGSADVPVQTCRVEEIREKVALAAKAGLDHLIVDLPPGIGRHTLAAINRADFLILPMRPTIFDLRATRQWIEILRSAAQRFGVVINGAPPRREGIDAPAVRDARTALESLGVRPWAGQITNRLIIPQACNGGRGVAEIDPTGPASVEYEMLWRAVVRALEQINIRSKHHEKHALRESVSIAPDAMPAADPFGEETSTSKAAADVARSGVLVRVTPALRREPKLAAFHRGTTVQRLLLEAIEIALGRHHDNAAPKGPAGA